MKKKLFIALIFMLSIFSFETNVKAEGLVMNGYKYECNNKNFSKIILHDDMIYCCPSGYKIKENKLGINICYNEKTGKTKSTRKPDKIGNNVVLTIKREGAADETRTCFKGNKDFTCTIDLSEFKQNDDKNYLGYSEKSDSKIENLNKSLDVKLDKSKTIYLYYGDLLAECKYENGLNLTYGKREINGYIGGKNINQYLEITGIMMTTYYNSGIICPPIIYSETTHATYQGEEIASATYYKLNGCDNGCERGNCECKILTLTSKVDYLDDGKKEIKKSKEGCAIIGDETMKIINDILKIIRIIVPLLLIGLGILDFTKSVFSGKEDDMNKNRSKFIKRIVAGVLVFFVPMFVNLILNFANDAWSWMNPDICIK